MALLECMLPQCAADVVCAPPAPSGGHAVRLALRREWGRSGPPACANGVPPPPPGPPIAEAAEAAWVGKMAAALALARSGDLPVTLLQNLLSTSLLSRWVVTAWAGRSVVPFWCGPASLVSAFFEAGYRYLYFWSFLRPDAFSFFGRIPSIPPFFDAGYL
eukprot:7213359-Pyramimonas_sp.AAC.1